MTETRLEMAERHLQQAEELICKQEEVVERLAANGSDAVCTSAKHVLEVMRHFRDIAAAEVETLSKRGQE